MTTNINSSTPSTRSTSPAPSDFSAKPSLSLGERAAILGWFVNLRRVLACEIGTELSELILDDAVKDFAIFIDTIHPDMKAVEDIVQRTQDARPAGYFADPISTKISLTTMRDIGLPLKFFSPGVQDLIGPEYLKFSAKLSQIIDEDIK
ncbi:hypothetical protein SCUP234_05558 [Seiridium cupressi]